MDGKILVAYASKHGATAEIAGRIGEVLNQASLNAEVMPVKKISSATGYDAFVIGSAAYIGQWRKEVPKFLTANEKLLAGKPVWLFSSGPSGEGDPVELVQGQKFPAKLQPVIDGIKPRDIAVFHGSLDASALNFLEKFMINMVKAPTGDFRDWDAITSWANAIAAELKK